MIEIPKIEIPAGYRPINWDEDPHKLICLHGRIVNPDDDTHACTWVAVKEEKMPEEKKATTNSDSKESASALAKPGTSFLATRPNWVKKDDVRGTEHLTKDDIQMPRIALAQSMSPQIDKEESSYIAGLEIGDMFNNLTGEILGKGPLEFTVILADRPRGVEFFPLDEGGGIKDFNVPLEDPRMAFGPDGRRPRATKFYDFILAMLPSRELIALSLKSTGLKTARQLNAFMRMRGTPSFVGKYSLSTKMTKNQKGKFAIFQVQNADWVDENTGRWAEQVYENIKHKEIIIEREQPDETPQQVADDVPFENQF